MTKERERTPHQGTALILSPFRIPGRLQEAKALSRWEVGMVTQFSPQASAAAFGGAVRLGVEHRGWNKSHCRHPVPGEADGV